MPVLRLRDSEATQETARRDKGRGRTRREQAIVSFQAGADVSDDQLREAVRKAGFTADTIAWRSCADPKLGRASRAEHGGARAPLASAGWSCCSCWRLSSRSPAGVRWSVPQAPVADATYTLLATWDGASAPGGSFDRPIGVAAAPSGDVYVTDARERVVHLNASGDVLGEWGREGRGRASSAILSAWRSGPTARYMCPTTNRTACRSSPQPASS